jgi:hypothetical protein
MHPLGWCKYCPSKDTTCSNAYIKAQAVDVPGIVIRRSTIMRREAATHPLMRSYNQANTSRCPASQQTHLGSMDILRSDGRVECCEQKDNCDKPTRFQHEKSSSACIVVAAGVVSPAVDCHRGSPHYDRSSDQHQKRHDW